MERELWTPQLTVVSGPMGGNKTAVNNGVIDGLRGIDIIVWGMERVFSISETSRDRRKDLVPPEPENAYSFNQPVERFITATETGLLMERVHHSDVHYGSPTPPEGQPTHLEIEVTGVKQIEESEHPKVIAARVGMKAVYLLQSSMTDLFNQIMGRPDGMTEAKKLQRIARYPSEIDYILDNPSLPYVFILNAAGRPELSVNNSVLHMLGDPSAVVESVRLARAKSEEAKLWLRHKGLKPEPIEEQHLAA